MKKGIRIIISGGGTGGHIFPAIAIANTLKARYADCEIKFVGALGRMEMEKVPAAGYEIIGLPVQGFDRSNPFKNIPVLYNLMISLFKARKIVRSFRPDVAVGVGGYASGPLMKAASSLKVPILIQEQNSFPGITNKILASKASTICVAYPGMEKYFPANRIVMTGNPVRKELLASEPNKMLAYETFGLSPNKKTILIIGGSLGARTINKAVLARLKQIDSGEVQVLWQTGKYYYEKAQQKSLFCKNHNLKVLAFIARMDLAYLIADLVISRAGASSISELCLLGKPTILVPSPNVAEDHQTKNAMVLVNNDAALLVKDDEAEETLIDLAYKLINEDQQLNKLHSNIIRLAEKDSADRIVDEIAKLFPKNKN
ncbi:MAG: undecaprenyldiphospho-muramoylpentapeptide beta-N-acetylglucosaminyltransferase [Bacteroidales bacterium]|jgi:UDP-N-acetylglucosamine--N-acetylmuramyl-(pentapeptide) pyrophosphoryl-undecaprenol N-acetylglucosamine transferase|nr:undecaprenyldiphospho-muramoylpentapeptide beta-N-acetylglucosaminyltransferase [Bacteroidales bacterium]